MSEPQEMEVGITLAEIEGPDPEHSLVEVLVRIPHFFGKKPRTMLVVPRTLFVIPGVAQIIQKTIPEIISAFVQSTGAKVAATEVKHPERFKIPPLPGELPN